MGKLIEDYLKDLTAFDITEGAIENVLIDAGVTPGSDVSTLSVKQMDLCKAYTYLWCASTPSISGSVEDSDSGWSHREGGKQTSAYDKRLLRPWAQIKRSLTWLTTLAFHIRCVYFGR